MEERLERLKHKTNHLKAEQEDYLNKEINNESYFDNQSSNTRNTNEDTGSMINYREMDNVGHSGVFKPSYQGARQEEFEYSAASMASGN